LSTNSRNIVYTDEQLAQEYFHFIQTNSENVLEQNIMKKLFPELEGKDCLEIGCAGAIYSRHMLSLIPNTVVSIDYSENMIKCAKKITGDSVSYFKRDINEPLNLGLQFDFICASFVLHYSSNLELTIKEISNVLKPNGVFIFSIPLPVQYYGKKLQPLHVRKTIRNNQTIEFFNYPLSYLLNEIEKEFIIEKSIINDKTFTLKCHSSKI